MKKKIVLLALSYSFNLSSFASVPPTFALEDRGVTHVEPWIEKLTEGSIDGYRQLVRDLDAGKLPFEILSTVLTMQSSLEPLLKEAEARDPQSSQTLRGWVQNLSNRLDDYMAKGEALPDDTYLEFAHFVAQAKGEAELLSDYRYLAGREAPEQDSKSTLRSLRKKYKEQYTPEVGETIQSHFVGGFSPLTTRQMNRMQGLRIFPVGLSLDHLIEYDNGRQHAGVFAGHDFGHGYVQVLGNERAYSFLRQKLPNDESIAMAFEDTQQAFREVMDELTDISHQAIK